MKKNVIIILSFVAFIIIVGVFIFLYSKSSRIKEYDLNKRIALLEKKHKADSIMLRRTAYSRDSLSYIAFYLNHYRALAEALYNRDTVRSHLKYKVGDVVMMKRDSSRAVINDIIIGGSQHEYYVKYRVQFRNKSIEEVLPEWIY